MSIHTNNAYATLYIDRSVIFCYNNTNHQPVGIFPLGDISMDLFMWILVATLCSFMGSITWTLAMKKPSYKMGFKEAPLPKIVAIIGVLMWGWLPVLCLYVSGVDSGLIRAGMWLVIAFSARLAGDELAWMITVRRLRKQQAEPLWWLHRKRLI